MEQFCTYSLKSNVIEEKVMEKNRTGDLAWQALILITVAFLGVV